jgi:SAM-dependent methyltransferase
MPKYSRYQDYVIRDGRLIGEFEQLYQDFEDPWHEASSEEFASDKAVAINLLRRLKEHHGISTVIELGCGFGHFSARMAATGLKAVGIDISPTAISIARARHGAVEFHAGSIEDHELIRRLQPDVIVMAEVTWYVLECLPGFLAFLRSELPNCYVLHLLTTYPPGVQTYGNEYFTDLAGIQKYFGMQYLESGEVRISAGTRTWFLGTWNRQAGVTWRRADDASVPGT